MLRIDDLCQLLSIDHFFVDPHVHDGVEAVGGFDIVPDDLGYGGAPGDVRRESEHQPKRAGLDLISESGNSDFQVEVT